MCKDNSCSDNLACRDATIPYVVGPSCSGYSSCFVAEIGSVDSSCKVSFSCADAQLSGVDLLSSCNKVFACRETNGDGVTELIDCCNDEDGQCFDKEGLDIVEKGCVSHMCTAFICLYLSNDSLFSYINL